MTIAKLFAGFKLCYINFSKTVFSGKNSVTKNTLLCKQTAREVFRNVNVLQKTFKAKNIQNEAGFLIHELLPG